MRVRHGDDVETLDGSRPQVGRYDILADIDARLFGASERRDAAGVDQHQRALREADEQAVALADVDGAQLEFAAFDNGREGMDDDDGRAWPRLPPRQRREAIGRSANCMRQAARINASDEKAGQPERRARGCASRAPTARACRRRLWPPTKARRTRERAQASSARLRGIPAARPRRAADTMMAFAVIPEMDVRWK